MPRRSLDFLSSGTDWARRRNHWVRTKIMDNRTVFVLSGVVVGQFLLLLYVMQPWTITINLETISIVGNLVLSALLVLLYGLNHQTQSEQTDIQKRQTGLQETQSEIQKKMFEPIISIEHVSLSGNSVSVWLSNFGEGSATDLSLVMYVEFIPRVRSLWSVNRKRLKRNDADDDARSGSVLEGNAEMVSFEATPDFHFDYEQELFVDPLDETIENILSGGFLEESSKSELIVTIGMWVVYEDVFDEPHHEFLPNPGGYRFFTDEPITLEESVNSMAIGYSEEILTEKIEGSEREEVLYENEWEKHWTVDDIFE